jgi:hypothetical protein
MKIPSDRKSKIWSVVRVSSGNFLEMYDFMVFGYYASAVGDAFFPSGNTFVSLMLSLTTFEAGFLMRPLDRRDVWVGLKPTARLRTSRSRQSREERQLRKRKKKVF